MLLAFPLHSSPSSTLVHLRMLLAFPSTRLLPLLCSISVCCWCSPPLVSFLYFVPSPYVVGVPLHSSPSSTLVHLRMLLAFPSTRLLPLLCSISVCCWRFPPLVSFLYFGPSPYVVGVSLHSSPSSTLVHLRMLLVFPLHSSPSSTLVHLRMLLVFPLHSSPSSTLFHLRMLLVFPLHSSPSSTLFHLRMLLVFPSTRLLPLLWSISVCCWCSPPLVSFLYFVPSPYVVGVSLHSSPSSTLFHLRMLLAFPSTRLLPLLWSISVCCWCSPPLVSFLYFVRSISVCCWRFPSTRLLPLLCSVHLRMLLAFPSTRLLPLLCSVHLRMLLVFPSTRLLPLLWSISVCCWCSPPLVSFLYFVPSPYVVGVPLHSSPSSTLFHLRMLLVFPLHSSPSSTLFHLRMLLVFPLHSSPSSTLFHLRMLLVFPLHSSPSSTLFHLRMLLVFPSTRLLPLLCSISVCCWCSPPLVSFLYFVPSPYVVGVPLHSSPSSTLFGPSVDNPYIATSLFLSALWQSFVIYADHVMSIR